MLDSLWIVFSGAVTYYATFGFSVMHAKPYLAAILFILFCVFSLSHFAQLFSIEVLLTPFKNLLKFLVVIITAFSLFIATVFSLDVSDYFLTTWVLAFALCVTCLIFTSRLFGYFITSHMVKSNFLARNVIIVGGGKQAELLLRQIDKKDTRLNNIIGIFDDRIKRIGPTVGGYPVLGNLTELVRYIRTNAIDDIIITLPWNADDRLFSIIHRLRNLPVHIHLSTDLIGFRFPYRPSVNHFIGIPMMEIVKTPLADWMVIVKKLEDILLTIIIIVLFAPLMVLIALAIRLESPGPVIFRQKRYGYNNKVFNIYKFRSMTHNTAPESTTQQATKGDARVTRVGRFIRRTSLDELPQFFNVLSGSMSLVGPRPHAVDHNEEYAKIIDGYFARHRVKPGITGWAQVNGFRGITDTVDKMEARVKHDVYYAENWSLFFDLEILLRTALVGFISKNSH